MPKTLLRLLYSLFLGVIPLLALPQKSKIEISANHIESTRNGMKAHDNVMVYYDGAVIKADRASYDRVKKRLVLDGNIEIIGYHGTKEHTEHMVIETEQKEVDFDTLFLLSEDDLWLYTQHAHKREGNYTLGASVLSSCDVEDPLWKMVFTRSFYDTKRAYMKVYDAKVYLWDIPVFYTPYMAFTTKQERSTGVLFPIFGYTSNEGLLFEQPLFWAISKEMDLELNPQIRSTRSTGIYSTFRFVDSAYSSGKIRTGYFKDHLSYVEQFGLPHDSHYGVEFNYDSSKVFKKILPKGVDDGLYINTTLLNDIDYLNLQSTHLNHFGLIPLQESRVNYFTNSNHYYTGVNAKYFIDTRKTSNRDTLQILPSLQSHQYLNHLIWRNLTYSADLRLRNFSRQEGVTLKQAEVSIPLEFNTAFLDDFLNLSLGEEIYYSKFFFGNDTLEHDTFAYFSNIQKIKLFSDLTKRYDDFVHVMQPSLLYTRPGYEYHDPVYASSLSDAQRALFTVGLPEESYAVGLNHYFYTETMVLKFYQRLSQLYYPNRAYRFADIDNEMQYSGEGWDLYNHTIYAPEYQKIRETSSRFLWESKKYTVSLGYTYKKKLEDEPLAVEANDIVTTFEYPVTKETKLTGGFTYSLNEGTSSQWRLGGGYRRDCWSIDIALRQDITPRPTTYTTDRSFFIQMNFIPFGTIGTGAQE